MVAMKSSRTEKDVPMKILIVDDETISRKVLVKNMESLEECVAVENATKGLAQIDLAAK